MKDEMVEAAARNRGTMSYIGSIQIEAACVLRRFFEVPIDCDVEWRPFHSRRFKASVTSGLTVPEYVLRIG